jgi:hypothetical protein
LASYKTISILFLIVVVALAVGSPAFAADDEAFIILTPAAACPGETVTVTVPIITVTVTDEVVGGGIGIAAVSPSLDDGRPFVLSSDPVGLVANPSCSPVPDVGSLVQGASFGNVQCTFVVSESATCGSHYIVTLAFSAVGVSVGQSRLVGSASFDVSGPCCAVGGCVQSVNTFALLSPWFVAIGLIGCIGTVVVARKRQS